MVVTVHNIVSILKTTELCLKEVNFMVCDLCHNKAIIKIFKS